MLWIHVIQHVIYHLHVRAERKCVPQDFVIVEVDDWRKIDLAPVELEFGDVGTGLLKGMLDIEVSLKQIRSSLADLTLIGTVAFVMAGEIGVDTHLIHHTENLLMVDLVTESKEDIPGYLTVSVAFLWPEPHELYLHSYSLVIQGFLRFQGVFGVFIGWFADLCDAQQFLETQSSFVSAALAELTDDLGFVGVFNRLFVSAKACNFFRYSFSACDNKSLCSRSLFRSLRAALSFSSCAILASNCWTFPSALLTGISGSSVFLVSLISGIFLGGLPRLEHFKPSMPRSLYLLIKAQRVPTLIPVTLDYFVTKISILMTGSIIASFLSVL